MARSGVEVIEIAQEDPDELAATEASQLSASEIETLLQRKLARREAFDALVQALTDGHDLVQRMAMQLMLDHRVSQEAVQEVMAVAEDDNDKATRQMLNALLTRQSYQFHVKTEHERLPRIARNMGAQSSLHRRAILPANRVG